jgi:hypothetical protein
MGIQRDDWGNGERSSFAEEPAKAVTPKNLDLAGDWGDGSHRQYDAENLPVEQRDILREMQTLDAPPSPAKPAASSGDLVAGITPRQAEAAAFTMEKIVAEDPRLYDLEDDIATLSDGVRAAIGRAVARKPNARGKALFDAIADELTLEQACEMREWSANLSPELNRLLMEWADG